MTRQEKLLQQFAQNTNDTLGNAYVEAMALKAKIDEEMKAILTVIETRFSGAATEEEIITRHGVFKRKVDNSWNVDADRVPELRTALGPRFPEIVRETTVIAVVEDQVPTLRNILGARYTEMIREHTGYVLTPKGRMALKKEPELVTQVGGLITVDTTTKVSFKPVADLQGGEA